MFQDTQQLKDKAISNNMFVSLSIKACKVYMGGWLLPVSSLICTLFHSIIVQIFGSMNLLSMF